ncbi:uncharacterized protein LOC111694670 [Trichogramma pretiosum]|uniref:uncharacterized protein LOC111694670 n=1 Tax=Trichogramma pretiosum TaxID=7493 RepID=UPI000C71C269|nr:uncharacterized protein LOC111694670 [Trichogramma pretiosum]
MTPAMNIFNFRLSHIRQKIECAFATLRNRCAVNHQELGWALSTTEDIIISTICLHNYSITMDFQEYRGFIYHWIDAPNGYMENVEQQEAVDLQFNANHVRNSLSQYFLLPAGSVPWQWEHL